MMNKKNIIAFLFILFVFYTINRVGNIIACNPKQHINVEQKVSVTQNSFPSAKETIFEIVGILQPSINANESNSTTFQNFKNIKKIFSLNSPLQLLLFSNSNYYFFCSKRINQIRISTLYIAYHRLII